MSLRVVCLGRVYTICIVGTRVRTRPQHIGSKESTTRNRMHVAGSTDVHFPCCNPCTGKGKETGAFSSECPHCLYSVTAFCSICNLSSFLFYYFWIHYGSRCRKSRHCACNTVLVKICAENTPTYGVNMGLRVHMILKCGRFPSHWNIQCRDKEFLLQYFCPTQDSCMNSFIYSFPEPFGFQRANRKYISEKAVL